MESSFRLVNKLNPSLTDVVGDFIIEETPLQEDMGMMTQQTVQGFIPTEELRLPRLSPEQVSMEARSNAVSPQSSPRASKLTIDQLVSATGSSREFSSLLKRVDIQIEQKMGPNIKETKLILDMRDTIKMLQGDLRAAG